MTTAFRPLQVAPGRVFVQNDGDVPTSYAVEVTVGRSVPTGFQTEVTRVFFSRVLEPGETEEVRVPITLPEGVTTGPKTVRVRLGTVSAIGTLGTILAQEFFSGRFTVEGLEMLPLPGEPPTEVVGLSPQNVTLQQPTAQPQEVQPGDRVTLTIPAVVQSVPGLAFPVVRVQVTITTNGQTVDELPEEEFELSSGQTNRLTADWVVPSDAAAGPYGAQIRIWDPNTVGTLGDLVQRNFSGLFRVLAGVLPAFGPQDLQVGAPAAQPTQVSPGDTVTFTLPVQIPTPAAQLPVQPRLGVGLDIIDPQGILTGQELVRTFDVGPGSNPLALQYTIPANAPAGPYDVGVQVWDPNTVDTLGVLFDQVFSGIFSVLLAALPELQLGSPRVSFFPVIVDQGDPIRGSVTIPVTIPVGAPALPAGAPELALPAELRVRLLDANRNFVRNLEVVPVTLSPGTDIGTSFLIRTDDLRGGYFVEIAVVDTRTNTVLLGPEIFPSAPLQVQVPAEMWEPGDLTVSAAPLGPAVAPGETVTVLLTIGNPSGKSLPTVITVELVNPLGVRSPLGSADYTPGGGATETTPQRIGVPAGAMEGSYGLDVTIADTFGRRIVFQPLIGVFRVEAEAPPVEEERPPRVGEVFLSYQGSSPASPSRGDRVFLVFNLRNTGPGGGDLEVLGFVRDSTGRSRNTVSATVTVGPNATTGFNLIIPSVAEDSPAGPWRIAVQVWDPRTFVQGDVSTFLIRQTTDPIFTIAALEPVLPAAPPLLEVSDPSLTPTTVDSGEELTGTWTVRNPRAETIRAFLLLSGPGGARTFQDIRAGQQATLRVTATVPTGQTLGPVTYTLSVRNSLNQVIEGMSESFTINIQAPLAVGFLRGDLSFTSATASPTQAEPGERVGFTVTFGVAARRVQDEFVRLSVSVLDPNNRTEHSFPDEDFDVTIGQQNRVTFNWPVASDATPGSYGLAIRIFDPDTVRTEGLLIDTRRTGLVRVVAALPTAEPTPTGELIGPVMPGFTVLTVNRPRAVPTVVSPGDRMGLQFFVQETAGVGGTVNFNAFGRDPAGQPVGFGQLSARIAARETTPVSLIMSIPSTAPRGTYGVVINYRPAGGSTVQNTFSSVFEVA